jgi:hypothetical protein
LYRIISGSYIECCGIGGDFQSALPNQSQAFVRLTIDQQTDLATMVFLGEDSQTTFSVVPCPPNNPISFSLDYGFLFSDTIVFHIDPGPPPYAVYWNYTVSNSVNRLRIDGTLGRYAKLRDLLTHPAVECRGGFSARTEAQNHGVFEGWRITVHPGQRGLEKCDRGISRFGHVGAG